MERTNSCGLKNLTFKQTKPFRATRQDDRDSFDRGASSLVSTAPRRIHAGRRLYCCPRSCVPGRPKPVGLSAAPVSIFERRYVTSGPSLQSHRAGAAEPRAPYRASDLVHWPDSEVAECADDFRFLGYSRHVVLSASLCESGPIPVIEPKTMIEARLALMRQQPVAVLRQ